MINPEQLPDMTVTLDNLPDFLGQMIEYYKEQGYSVEVSIEQSADDAINMMAKQARLH